MSSFICTHCRSRILRQRPLKLSAQLSRTNTILSIPPRPAHRIVSGWRKLHTRAEELEEIDKFEDHTEIDLEKDLEKARTQYKQAKLEARRQISDMLATPSWSVKSLAATTPEEEQYQDEITEDKIRHLLKLAALPIPKDPQEISKMLCTLRSQLKFVRDVQAVNTERIEPLQRIADETEEGKKESTIGLKDLKEALEQEVVVGRSRRHRRLKEKVESTEEKWDVFSTAGETVEIPGSGRYFVVRSGKPDMRAFYRKKLGLDLEDDKSEAEASIQCDGYPKEDFPVKE